MARPQGESDRTSLGVSKDVKRIVRMCAERARGRRGYESDEQVIRRVFEEYISRRGINGPARGTYEE